MGLEFKILRNSLKSRLKKNRKILHLKKNNHLKKYAPRSNWQGGTSAEKNLSLVLTLN